jgi:glycosyltransferase involved in cell wall biosynthesis
MRLLLLTFYPLDVDVVPSGIRAVSLNLVQGLRAYDDLELHVLHCHSDVEADHTVRQDGVTVHYLAMPRRRIVPNLITSIGRIVRQIHVLDPDLVHAHAAHFAYASVRAGYPTLYTIHGVMPKEREIYSGNWFDRLRYAILAYYERRALRGVRGLVAVSPYVRQVYDGWLDGQEQLCWVGIDNPVPPSFLSLRDRTEPGRILYIGSITEIKDILTLLRAMVRVRDARPETQLRIAGRVTSESYESRVHDFVAQHNLEDAVCFLGLLSRQEIVHEYERCAVLALSSLQENAPMVIIEAMAAAKPVVATRVGGVSHLVSEGATGFMVPAGDDEAMAGRLIQLLDDEELRQRLGRRAREVARERHALDQVAASYHALYQRVLEER